MKNVFVSGSWDLLHSGHVTFLKEASQYGDLYVGIGSDKSIEQLKGRKTIYPEQERLYMVKATRYVKGAWINSETGNFDFFEDIKDKNIDILIVNEDQDFQEKRDFCKKEGIEYIVLERKPESGLPVRSSTEMRQNSLVELFDKGGVEKYDSDKGSRHSYLPIYDDLFFQFKHRNINLFEVGYCKGGSCKLWDDYFSIAKIKIIDIEGDPFNSGKIQFELKDSNDLTSEYFKDFIPDIALDDGSHDLADQLYFIKIIYPILKKGGLLIIEDVSDIDNQKPEFIKLGIPFEIIDLRNVKGRYDDVLILYRK